MALFFSIRHCFPVTRAVIKVMFSLVLVAGVSVIARFSRLPVSALCVDGFQVESRLKGPVAFLNISSIQLVFFFSLFPIE